MRVSILGSGGGAPSAVRETSCVLVRDGERALLLDLGTGGRRLLTDAALLDGVAELHVVLTHFHFDHVCGIPYLPWLSVAAAIWAPGEWLYGRPSAEILEPLRRPPFSPTDVTGSYPVNELASGTQTIAGFDVHASPQPQHWAPSAGLRIDDHLAFITDTPYEASSSGLADGVVHLLHEAWSSSRTPIHPDRDATAADAARVAREAGAAHLTLIHLNPELADLTPVLADAEAVFESVALGQDEMTLG
ncbi:MAG TPA: MBL fold metallo-hydrolase [Gaiellaceae bacterium]